LKVVEKLGDEVSVVALPGEEVAKGDYLLIEDVDRCRGLLVQVYDERYLEHPGVVEDIVREEVVKAPVDGVESDPLQINTLSYLIRDVRLLKCKIRGCVEGGELTPNASWTPSRARSKIRKISVFELLDLVRRRGFREISLGEVSKGEVFKIFAESLDGQLNIITGRKGSGKSHLAKLLASDLVRYGAYVFIFDLNDEYGGLAWSRDGSPSLNAEKTIILKPGGNLVFTLRYIGLPSILGLMRHVFDTPGATLREFIRIWEVLEARGALSLRELGEVIQSHRCNEYIRDALYSRYHAMLSSGLFSDEECFEIEDVFKRLKNGGLIVISLGRTPPSVRRMVVELFLGRLIQLVERDAIPPIFLFAEEAHLYLRETYWEDIVTRMRHFGIFSTFITNQPDAIGDEIYRQVDNIFLFNFTNDADLEKMSRVSSVDGETVRSVVKSLPPRTCLILGRVVDNLPVVVKVSPTDMMTMGETKLFFRDACRMPLVKQIP